MRLKSAPLGHGVKSVAECFSVRNNRRSLNQAGSEVSVVAFDRVVRNPRVTVERKRLEGVSNGSRLSRFLVSDMFKEKNRPEFEQLRNALEQPFRAIIK